MTSTLQHSVQPVCLEALKKRLFAFQSNKKNILINEHGPKIGGERFAQEIVSFALDMPISGMAPECPIQSPVVFCAQTLGHQHEAAEFTQRGFLDTSGLSSELEHAGSNSTRQKIGHA